MYIEPWRCTECNTEKPLDDISVPTDPPSRRGICMECFAHPPNDSTRSRWGDLHAAALKGLQARTVLCIHCDATVPLAESASNYGVDHAGQWIGKGVCRFCQHAIDALPGSGNGMSDDDDHGPVMV